MQGAMRSMSSKSFQASAGGSGTSNELSNSMTLSLPAGADHVRRAQLLPDPARPAEQLLVGVARRHELNADRQTVRAAVGRQGERGDVENGPDRLKAGIAGLTEAARRLAVGARREQHVDLPEHGGELRATILPEPQRRDIFGTRHGAPELDALAQALADRLAMTAPFVRHRRRTLVIVDGLARGEAQTGEL